MSTVAVNHGGRRVSVRAFFYFAIYVPPKTAMFDRLLKVETLRRVAGRKKESADHVVCLNTRLTRHRFGPPMTASVRTTPYVLGFVGSGVGDGVVPAVLASPQCVWSGIFIPIADHIVVFGGTTL